MEMDNNLFKPSISEDNGLNLIRKTDINILSVGISTRGSAEIRMLEGNSNRHVIATTIDTEGLEDTRNILKSKDLLDKIEVKYKDVAERMPYEDEHFDFVYARLVLHYLDNKHLENALHELNRVMKKGGQLFIVVKSMDDWQAKLEGTTYCEETGISTYPKYRTLGTDDVKYTSRRLHTPESMSQFLEKSNFNILHIKEYKELLYSDYMRTKSDLHESSLIEFLASK